jgi:hypothetical protein
MIIVAVFFYNYPYEMRNLPFIRVDQEARGPNFLAPE